MEWLHLPANKNKSVTRLGKKIVKQTGRHWLTVLHRNQRPEWKVNLYVSPARGSVLNCLGGSDFQLAN